MRSDHEPVASKVLRSLLVETKDGEWGAGEAEADTVAMRVIRGTDFDDARQLDLSSVPIRHIAQRHAARKSLRAGDVLIETAGGSKGKPTGRTVFLREELFSGSELPLTCASFARYLRFDAAHIEPEYAYWWLQSLYQSGQIETYQVQHSGIARFQFTKFADEMHVPLPERRAQELVVETLGTIERRVTSLRQTNATLESIAQALFKSWFIDFDPVRAKAEGREPEGMDAATAALFPAAFEESALGVIPKGWRVLPFLQACDLIGGAQPPASTFVDEPRERYVRLLQIRDFSTDSHVTYVPETKKLKRAVEDDVLIGRYGSASGDRARDSLGRVCRGLSGAYNVALMKLSPIEIGREFALQLVNAPSFYNYLQGVSAKAVQSGFSKSELGNLSVVVPPRTLADVYEALGVVLWQRVKANRAQAHSVESLRDTLLPRLISGKLHLPEAQARVADALGAAA